MNKFLAFFLITCVASIFSCQPPNQNLGDFKLLPQPQEYDILGVSNLKYDALSEVSLSEGADLPVLGGLLKNLKKSKDAESAQIFAIIDEAMDLPKEGYILNILKDKIELTAKDKIGLFYGFKTLEQLTQDSNDQAVNLPLCAIKDFPLLAFRAIHLDIKHHLEKTDYYYALLDKLSSYKINGIIVELEDKIQYKRQPLIASKDALSIEEWIKLSDYAKERHIEISPLIQGLGHASFVLKHDKYKDLRDDPQSDWAFNPLDSKTYEVQFDLYLDAIEATPHGKYLHIGGDEVHTTGRGSGKSPLELQLNWLDKVCKFAEAHNRIPIFWDDMPLKHAGVYRPMFNAELTEEEVDKIWEENEYKLIAFLDQFPKNCIYMRWNYSSSQAIGNGKAMEWFRKNGLQVMGATAGQTRWVLMPQNESNMDNIRSFAMSSIENGLNGLLLTLWDDDSPHFELYMRGILAFAEYSWSGDKRSKDDIKSAYRHREFSNNASSGDLAFIDQLEKPVAFWKNALLQGNKRNYLHQDQNANGELLIEFPDRMKKGSWSEEHAGRIKQATAVVEQCDSIAEKITVMKSKAQRNGFNLEVYEQVNKLVRFTSKALLSLNTLDNAQSEQQELEAISELKQLPSKFAELRSELEEVYGKTRILTKPDDYILDQDHHVHLANQTTSFDWQFYSEILFLEKLDVYFEKWEVKN
jgi:hypothetical protein